MANGAVSRPRVLMDGLGMGESPRWHDGRLWFSSWGTDEIVAVDLEGKSEVIGPGGGGAGWAVNWLPDGSLLVTGRELIRLEPDGSRVRHSDLSQIAPYGVSEINRRRARPRVCQHHQLRFRRLRQRHRQRTGSRKDRTGHV